MRQRAAFIWVELGDLDQAENLLKTELKTNPISVWGQEYWADCLIRRSKTGEAVAAYERLLRDTRPTPQDHARILAAADAAMYADKRAGRQQRLPAQHTPRR